MHVYYIFIIHSVVHGHIDCFDTQAIMSTVTMNMTEQVSPL